jgi:hypothetical protein
VTRRAGDVNPPVTVRARVASAAPGAHQGRYRPIDIDRSPFMMENRRVNGGLKVHGTLTGRRLGRGSARVESGEETAGA